MKEIGPSIDTREGREFGPEGPTLGQSSVDFHRDWLISSNGYGFAAYWSLPILSRPFGLSERVLPNGI